MADSGLLAHADVELLDGIVVPKITRNSWHDATLGRVHLLLVTALLSKPWQARNQSAMVTNRGVPEPDIALVRGTHDDYLVQRPTSRDTGLVIEISDSTLKLDRQKAEIYADAGVPQYWIISAVDQCVEIYDQLQRDAAGQMVYGAKRIIRGSETVQLSLDGTLMATFAADQLVPPLPVQR
nr:Uma2 family endonuclease [Anatilimnocola floriformis]